jgi:Protein of unknown function (DUF664)
MTWTAPTVERPKRDGTAGERAALDAALDHQRRTLLFKCEGLTGEQLAARPLEPSRLSLLGLIRHMAHVERWWFRRRFNGEQGLDRLFATDDDLDRDFEGGTPQSAQADYATYLAEVEQVRALLAGRSLDETFTRPPGTTADLRWLYFHLIEEYARHNGHADLLREHLDGRTGE